MSVASKRLKENKKKLQTDFFFLINFFCFYSLKLLNKVFFFCYIYIYFFFFFDVAFFFFPYDADI